MLAVVARGLSFDSAKNASVKNTLACPPPVTKKKVL